MRDGFWTGFVCGTALLLWASPPHPHQLAELLLLALAAGSFLAGQPRRRG